MSRSFVRAWATVATIMAMVCLAFVQPMPEHVSSSVAKMAVANPGIKAAATTQLSTTAPFVDSIMTGKTFTPYVTLGGSMLVLDGASRPAARVVSLEELRSPPLEPPTRPG